MEEELGIFVKEETLSTADTADKACKPVDAATAKKQTILHICALVFSYVITIVALLTFFVAFFSVSVEGAYLIVSTYVLAMLLAAPTLKVFLDKCTCPNLKKANIIALLATFATILILVVMVFLNFAFSIGYAG